MSKWVEVSGTIVTMSGDGYHPPLEEYLEAVHELEEEGVTVIQARLAERIGHSAPSVSEMVRRLVAEAYIEMEGRELHLTPKGRELAESVVRKHRLAERLLTDVLGLEWHKTHLEACRWEHVISDEVEARIVEVLGNPATCPHGNPIPGSGYDPPDAVRLIDCREGESVTLRRVLEELELDYDSLLYLATHQFIPGATAKVVSRAPDGTVMVSVEGGGVVALGPAMAAALFVTTNN